MAKMKLLSTDLARMVVLAAAINDICAWILLAVGVAISGLSTSLTTPAYVRLWVVGFVIFMLFIVKRFMEWIAHRASGQENVSEIYVCITMMGVLLSAFSIDAISIHPLFGAFVFGLIVPKEEAFSQKLIEKINDFVIVLMLPLFFASSGLKMNLQADGRELRTLYYQFVTMQKWLWTLPCCAPLAQASFHSPSPFQLCLFAWCVCSEL